MILLLAMEKNWHINQPSSLTHEGGGDNNTSSSASTYISRSPSTSPQHGTETRQLTQLPLVLLRSHRGTLWRGGGGGGGWWQRKRWGGGGWRVSWDGKKGRREPARPRLGFPWGSRSRLQTLPRHKVKVQHCEKKNLLIVWLDKLVDSVVFLGKRSSWQTTPSSASPQCPAMPCRSFREASKRCSRLSLVSPAGPPFCLNWPARVFSRCTFAKLFIFILQLTNKDLIYLIQMRITSGRIG